MVEGCGEGSVRYVHAAACCSLEVRPQKEEKSRRPTRRSSASVIVRVLASQGSIVLSTERLILYHPCVMQATQAAATAERLLGCMIA